jgi:DNA (cytosine-5)-methyltransferase 1
MGGGDCSFLTAKTLLTKTRLDSETENLIPMHGGHFGEPIFSLAGNTIGRQPLNGGNGNGYDVSGASYTLTKTDVHAVAFKVRGGCEGGGKGYLGSDDTAFTLSTNQDQHLFNQMRVRRLTPKECARLQGFPDDYLSQVKGATDSSMYKALGNSMAVNVMQLLGERIEMVNQIEQVKAVA